MTHTEIVDYCLKKTGTYLDYPFGPITPVVKVKAPSQDKGRIFVQIFMLRGKPKATFNCTPESADFYRSIYPGSIVRD